MIQQRTPPRARVNAATPQVRRQESLTGWGVALLGIVTVSFGLSVVVGFRASLAFITLTGYAAALVGAFRPAVGLLGIGVLCTLDAPARIYLLTGGLFRYNTLNYILLLVLLLSVMTVLRFREVHTRLLLILICLLTVEILISPDVAFGVQHVFNVVSLLGLLVYFERGAINKQTWVWLGLVCGMTGAAGGLAFNLQKAVLPFANPNALAYFPLGALFAVCLAFRFADSSARTQLALAALAAVNILWVFLTASRGSLLVASFCALFLIYSVPSVGRRAVVVGTLAVLGLVASSHFTNLQDTAIARLEALVDPTRSLASRTSGRSDLILGGWYIFQDHPLGVGTGGFATAWADLGRREGLSGFQEGEKFQAHAGWIKILAENGLPGFALLVAFVGSFAVSGLRRRESRTRMLGLFTSVVLSVAWISTEFQAKGLWLLVAGAMTLLRAPEAPERRSPQRVWIVHPRRVMESP
jgi:O-antigen ligase